MRPMRALARRPDGSTVTVDLDVTVDLQAIADELATKARNNKSMQARECAGAVLVEFICEAEPNV